MSRLKKILITTSSFGVADPSLLVVLQQQGYDVVLNPFARKLTEAEAFDLVAQHRPVGLIAGVEPLTKKVLQQARGVRVVSRCGIGLDSVDLQAAKELGIIVTNTPDAPTIAVAELTLGMILALFRKIHISDASIRTGGWERPMGNLLCGKTVGLIGCGRVGSSVAKLLTGFGCHVLGYDPVTSQNDYVRLLDLDSVIQQAEVLSLHVPYSPANHHLLDKERIYAMPQGAVLINTARGGLVDEGVLLEALLSGHLAGAAIDSFEQEPYAGPLKDLTNVVLTAHLGSYAKEARMMMEQQAVENLLRELEKERGVA
jgi:D-3-phosphoglycerate dehydrogenase